MLIIKQGRKLYKFYTETQAIFLGTAGEYQVKLWTDGNVSVFGSMSVKADELMLYNHSPDFYYHCYQ